MSETNTADRTRITRQAMQGWVQEQEKSPEFEGLMDVGEVRAIWNRLREYVGMEQLSSRVLLLRAFTQARTEWEKTGKVEALKVWLDAGQALLVYDRSHGEASDGAEDENWRDYEDLVYAVGKGGPDIGGPDDPGRDGEQA